MTARIGARRDHDETAASAPGGPRAAPGRDRGEPMMSDQDNPDSLVAARDALRFDPKPLEESKRYPTDLDYVKEQLMARKNAQIRDLQEELERTKSALTISEASARYWQHQAETQDNPDTPVSSRDALREAARSAARKLYAAEVHRQGVGWDAHCTDLLVRAQHELVAALEES